MYKIIGVISLIIFMTLAGIVVADYFALFGIKEKHEYVLREIKLRPVHKLTNSPIVGARVSCFQQANRKACTQRDSGKLGIVSVMVPGTRISSNSLLFEHDHRYINSKDPNIQIMLIHVDYVNQVKSIVINNHFSNPEQVYRVMMEPRDSVQNDDQ